MSEKEYGNCPSCGDKLLENIHICWDCVARRFGYTGPKSKKPVMTKDIVDKIKL